MTLYLVIIGRRQRLQHSLHLHHFCIWDKKKERIETFLLPCFLAEPPPDSTHDEDIIQKKESALSPKAVHVTNLNMNQIQYV